MTALGNGHDPVGVAALGNGTAPLAVIASRVRRPPAAPTPPL